MIHKEVNTYLLDENSIRSVAIEIEEPRICMHCKNTGDQLYITGCGTLGKMDRQKGGICIFACKFCGSNTIHLMEVTDKNKDSFDSEKDYYLKSIETIPFNTTNSAEISDSIKKMSPDFHNIYNEANQAEEQKLKSIAGMAYRKAVEFLITDYLLSYPVEGVSEEWLKDYKTSLSNKINVLPNETIKNLSKAISFIGNDETHYTRRHPEHDIESIKMFLKALLSHIDNEMVILEANKLLNKPK
ncbi:hypothetical protein IGI37_002098 [Enterococcus sp. AZ194]|uniref:hypothetical protein n=1 Tax=Enterococcus sp. AZ194 TaxID=2774629 RepID=UPI003F218BE1